MSTLNMVGHRHHGRAGLFPVGDGYKVDVNEFDYRDDNGIWYERDGVVIRHWRRVHGKDGSRDKLVAMAESSGTLVDTVDFVYLETSCPTLDAEGDPIFTDSNHARASYAATAVTFLDPYLR